MTKWTYDRRVLCMWFIYLLDRNTSLKSVSSPDRTDMISENEMMLLKRSLRDWLKITSSQDCCHPYSRLEIVSEKSLITKSESSKDPDLQVLGIKTQKRLMRRRLHGVKRQQGPQQRKSHVQDNKRNPRNPRPVERTDRSFVKQLARTRSRKWCCVLCCDPSPNSTTIKDLQLYFPKLPPRHTSPHAMISFFQDVQLCNNSQL